MRFPNVNPGLALLGGGASNWKDVSVSIKKCVLWRDVYLSIFNFNLCSNNMRSNNDSNYRYLTSLIYLSLL